jgi:chorismate mutase
VKERAAFRAEERRSSVTTNQATAPGEDMSPTRMERLDEEIIALLARRREMAQELPAPARARAADPGFVEAVREITDRYRQELGGAGELVARAVMVLCHPGRRN